MKVVATITQAGTRDGAVASAEDGTEYTISAATISSSSRLKGPTGKPLAGVDLIVGTEVTLDVRKRTRVERIEAVVFPDGAAEATAAARAAEQEAQRAERQRGLQREEAERARQEAASAHARGEFNPYMFLPFRSPRPEKEGSRPRHRTAPQEAVAAAPSGASPLLSGRIRLRLDLASPLVTYGAERGEAATHELKLGNSKDGEPSFERLKARSKKAQHGVVTLLRDAAGRPTIAGSSLKGTMRSWLEFITGGHRDISPAGVAWREPAVNDPHRLCGVLLLYSETEDGDLDALESISASDDRPLPAHVVAYILPLRFAGFKEQGEPTTPKARGVHRARLMWRQWEPVAGSGGGTVRLEHGTMMRGRRDDGKGQHGILQVGIGAGGGILGVRVAALPAGMTRKELQSIEPPSYPGLVRVPREALEVWYEAHRKGGGPQRPERIDADGTSLTFVAPDARELHHAKPVFYRLEGDRITYLSVIRGGRNAVATIPADRYPPGLPAHEDDRLDAARRIFGRVPDKRSTDAKDRTAWAGRVRIGPVRYEGEGSTETFTLLPLMGPKVQSAGFYLTHEEGRVSWAPGQKGRLAGTKVYWHQPPVPVPGAEVDLAARVRSVAVAKGVDGAPARTATNRTVEALTDGSFRLDVWFEDLDEQELGALLLAVSLRFRDEERVGWRVGLGRPLGFGSVVNRIESVELVDDGGPTALPMRVLAADELDERLVGARDHWFGQSRSDLAVAAGIAALDSVRGEQFGYPRIGSTNFNVKDRAFDAQEPASVVLGIDPARPRTKGGRPRGGR